MKQYTITEYNDWEGETFGYILMLTDSEYDIIAKAFEDSESFEIKPSEYTYEQVDMINKHSSNSYMSRLQFVRLSDDVNLSEIDEETFYKRNNLDLI